MSDPPIKVLITMLFLSKNNKHIHILTLNQPLTHKCACGLHKPIRIYMGVLILGVNTLYTVFYLVYEIPMVWKELKCNSIIEKGPQSVSFIGFLYLECLLSKVLLYTHTHLCGDRILREVNERH